MFSKLNKRDKRALKLCIAGVVIIPVLFLYALPCLEDWRVVRGQLSSRREKIKSVTSDSRLASQVLNFEVPRDEKLQGSLFRDEFSRQLKKAGIKAKSVQFVSSRKDRRVSGYKSLFLQCRAECSFEQVVSLLAALKANPYFVGVESVTLKCDSKDRNKMNVVLTVSTFAK
jgi:hypothetical protein